MLLFYRIRNPFSCFLRTIKAIWFQKIIYTVQNLRQEAGADGLLKSKIFLSDNCKYSYEPVISCLEAVAFFRVSKLTHCRPKEAVQFGPRSKPCKRQTAPAAGHGRQPFTGRGYFFSLNTPAPCFLRLLTWGSLTPSPFSFAALRSRGFPHSKSRENYGGFR